MQLFSKKKPFMEGIVVEYYDGDLNGFTTNMPCNIVWKNDYLQISKLNPDVTVTLAASRIIKIDFFWKEADYMLKYKGHAISPSKLEKSYFVVHYNDKNGRVNHLDFWCFGSKELKYIKNIQEDLFSGKEPEVYEI